MGTPKEPEPVKLVVPMLASDTARFDLAAQELAGTYGPIDYTSPLLPFDQTHYYEHEFGPGLLRRFISFARLIDRRQLAGIKVLTNELEAVLIRDGRRTINLDPGYMSPGKFVLATTKNHSHRIYLGQGIFAEVTLYYQDGHYQAWPWTYRDYATKEYAQILTEIRALYMKQRRGL